MINVFDIYETNKFNLSRFQVLKCTSEVAHVAFNMIDFIGHAQMFTNLRCPRVEYVHIFICICY